MVNRRSFKSDVSFLENISMGATGTIAVFNNLKEQGHTPIELERGSRSFKIWKNIKIKRIRVPDILCVDCGKCIECRTKTKLEISMSHSLVDPERGWDYGLDDNDFVAFVVCNRAGDKPVDWRASELVQYVSVKDLRLAQRDGRAISTKPKGAEEGFEIRIIWPATIANASGNITSISQDRIQYQRQTDKRLITLRLSKKGQVMMPLVKNGDNIAVNQILASVVPVSFGFHCDKSAPESHYIKLLSSTSLSKRYMAAKALAFFDSPEVLDSLVNKLNDSSEHIYVRLESGASLAHRDDKRGYDFIKACLSDEYLQNRLEAVIVLGEIAKDAVNTVWWLAKTDFPKADITRVLVPYSERMKLLLQNSEKYYSPKKRPLGHDISAHFGEDNGGAIPPNLLQIPNTESSSQYLRCCKILGVQPHPARFPQKLPEFFIKLLTDVGDTVLDIFAGRIVEKEGELKLSQQSFDRDLNEV